MSKQKEKLSYARLVTRADYYKNKALEMEQQVVFARENARELERKVELAKEKVKDLDNQLDTMKKKHENLDGEKEMKLNQLRELNESLEKEQRKLEESYEKLKNEVENLKKEGLSEKKKVEDEAEALKNKLAEKDRDIKELQRNRNDEEKRRDFEKLLSEVQGDLNEKEALIDSYQQRIRSLEQRINREQSIPVNKVFAKKEETRQVERKAIAYFDYTIVLNENKQAVIRGNFHIQNVGSLSLGTPYVCFRFYPVDASALKGKILSLEKTSLNERTSKPQWVFMDGGWGDSAKERGEIWVRPYEEQSIHPDESLLLSDFQIPVKKHYDENVMIEGFVYFQKDEYKQKAANQILISF